MIDNFFSRMKFSEKHKTWISHAHPRFISSCADPIIDQLTGPFVRDHEICFLIIRRLNQLDANYLYLNTARWRHIFEPDFSTNVLAGEKVWELQSIQLQFVGPSITYSLGECRMLFVPVLLEIGWSVYAWDMVLKIIHIMDPFSSDPSYYTNKPLHDMVADQLHTALFLCIY